MSTSYFALSNTKWRWWWWWMWFTTSRLYRRTCDSSRLVWSNSGYWVAALALHSSSEPLDRDECSEPWWQHHTI